MTTVVLGRRLALWRTVTPLGIRFWDPALDAPVDDGLTVWAFRADAPALGPASGGGVRAFRTPSGVYAFEGLPGLEAVEHPAPDAPVVPDAASLASPPFAADFVIAVRDERARFLPMAFTVRLPLAERGLFLRGAPGGARVPLFSAPTRAVPPGLSAVRAELWEVDVPPPEAPRPAAHAVLRVEVGGATWTGIADARGRALVVFPTPTAARLSLGSPAGTGGGGDVASQSWPLVVRAAWEPRALRHPLAGARGAAAAWADTPSVKSVLDEQGPALLYEADDAAPAEALHPELPYARELVLRTRLTGAHAGAPEEAGRLWLSRGASPP